MNTITAIAVGFAFGVGITALGCTLAVLASVYGWPIRTRPDVKKPDKGGKP